MRAAATARAGRPVAMPSAGAGAGGRRLVGGVGGGGSGYSGGAAAAAAASAASAGPPMSLNERGLDVLASNSVLTHQKVMKHSEEQ